MKSSKWVAFAGAGIACGLITTLAGCPALSPSTTPSTSPTSNPSSGGGTSYNVGDYFFPPSATIQLLYTVTGTYSWPTGDNFAVAGDATQSVLSWSSHLAVAQEDMAFSLQTPQGTTVSTSTKVATLSLNPDGSMTDSEGSGQGSDVTTFPANLFNGSPLTVSPASGDISLTTAQFLGAESVTVPAGTFDAIKIQVDQASDSSGQSTQITRWYSKNMDFVKMIAISTGSVQTGANSTGVATMSLQAVLRSFTR